MSGEGPARISSRTKSASSGPRDPRGGTAGPDRGPSFGPGSAPGEHGWNRARRPAVIWEAKAARPSRDEAWKFGFTYVNQQAEEVLGYKREAWLQEPDFWLERVHPEDRDRARGLLERVASRRLAYDYLECRTLTADGRARWFRIRVHRLQDIDFGGARIGAMMSEIAEPAHRDEECYYAAQDQCNLRERLRAHSRIVSGILEMKDQDDMLGIVLGEALVLFRAECGAIYLSDHEGVRLKVNRGFSKGVHDDLAFFPHDELPAWMSGPDAVTNAPDDAGNSVPELGRDPEIRSWAWVPVPAPSKGNESGQPGEAKESGPPLGGGLLLCCHREGAFRGSRLSSLNALGEQLALAIRHAEFADRARAETQVRAGLLRLDSALNRARSPQKVCDAAAQLLPGLFPETETYVWRWDARRSQPYPATASLNIPPDRRALFLSAAESYRGSASLAKVARTRKPLYVSDLLTDPRKDEALWQDLGLRTLLVLPLSAGDEFLGLICFARRMFRPLSVPDFELARGASQGVASALQGEEAREEILEQRSDLEDANEELRKAQQAMMAQERLRALGEMASGMAHDIGNALSPIVGYTDLLLNEEDNLSERARRFLETIKTAGSDIERTVGRMKDFYRRRDEREELVPVDLNGAVAQVIDLTRPRWRDLSQGKGILVEVRNELQADLPKIMGVESEVRDGVTNLILNSVDAMPRGGAIALRTWATTEKVVLEVRDQGTGMDEETCRRCLEPFYSTKGKKGTGLGLAIVFGAMERHNGQVQIQSKVGEGTAIRLIFPRLDTEPTVEASQAVVAPPGLRPLRILYIDDEPSVCELVQEILGADGHTTDLAASGQVGLDAFHAAAEAGEPYDAVITDLGMPHLDGREVARIIKSGSPETPVILLTAWAKEVKTQQGAPEGVDAILRKPPKAEELRVALTDLCSSPPGPA